MLDEKDIAGMTFAAVCGIIAWLAMAGGLLWWMVREIVEVMNG